MARIGPIELDITPGDAELCGKPRVVALFPCDVCHELSDFAPDQISDISETLVCSACQEALDAPI